MRSLSMFGCLLLAQVTACVPGVAAVAAQDQADNQDDSRYLFPFFRGNGEAGVYLAVSDDGLNYREANFGRPIFIPPDWERQSLTRDPSIVYHDGVFHMVWTSNWSGNVMGYASSPDLRTWSEPLKIQPFPDDVAPKNIWAPEIHRDPVREDFFIVFSSTLPDELNDGDGSEDPHGNDHRPYVIRTSDFEAFSTAEVLIDPGLSTIDPHLVYDRRGTEASDDDRWVMVYKSEVGPDRGGKNLRLAFRDPRMEEPWEVVPEPVAGPGSDLRAHEWAEGPALLLDGDRWLLYWDSYGNGHYSAARSPDLEQWTDVTDELRMPDGHPRHGTPLKAPVDGLDVPTPSSGPAGSLYNGSFEHASGGSPGGWGSIAWSGSGTFTHAPAGGRGGGGAAAISTEGGDLAWSAYAVVEPFTKYRLAGWIRTEGVAAGGGRGALLNVYGLEGAATGAVTGTTGWTKVETVFETRLQRDIRINCLLGGWGQSRGAAWFDDVMLELACPGDRDGDGRVGVTDLLMYLRAFRVGC